MSTKRKADRYDKSDPFVASDDETTTSRPSKKAKGISSNGIASGVKKDDEGNQYWEISKSRRVTISEFKGKKMVSIREYYEKDGKQLPGRKGISMTVEQCSTFVELLPEIEKTLSASGEQLTRPKYGEKPAKTATQDEDESQDDDDADDKKANFEATGDEDED